MGKKVRKFETLSFERDETIKSRVKSARENGKIRHAEILSFERDETKNEESKNCQEERVKACRQGQKA